MAKQTNNVVTHGLSGKVGDLLVFRQRAGKTVVAKAPPKRKVTTEQQKEQQRKFQRAVLYAKSVIADSAGMGAVYNKAAKKGLTAYNVAVADFFHAPDIQNIDVSGYTGQPGDIIRIEITDDFAVKEVKVTITNADGSLVEKGFATPDAVGYLWIYTATATNDSLDGDKIEITASDLPGNVTQEAINV